MNKCIGFGMIIKNKNIVKKVIWIRTCRIFQYTLDGIHIKEIKDISLKTKNR